MDHHLHLKAHWLAPRLECNLQQLANPLKLCHPWQYVFGNTIKISLLFNFSNVATSAESTGICSLEYSFGSFAHWNLLSLNNGCFETISPSINDDVTFLLLLSVFMLIEVLTPDNPSFLSRLSVTKVLWLHESNKICCSISSTCTIAFQCSFIFIINHSITWRFLVLCLVTTM